MADNERGGPRERHQSADGVSPDGLARFGPSTPPRPSGTEPAADRPAAAPVVEVSGALSGPAGPSGIGDSAGPSRRVVALATVGGVAVVVLMAGIAIAVGGGSDDPAAGTSGDEVPASPASAEETDAEPTSELDPVQVADDAGVIVMEVPAAWDDEFSSSEDDSVWEFQASENRAALMSADPPLPGGVAVTASLRTGDPVDTGAAVADALPTLPGNCVDLSTVDYDDGVYVGTERSIECEGGNLYLIAAGDDLIDAFLLISEPGGGGGVRDLIVDSWLVRPNGGQDSDVGQRVASDDVFDSGSVDADAMQEAGVAASDDGSLFVVERGGDVLRSSVDACALPTSSRSVSPSMSRFGRWTSSRSPANSSYSRTAL